MARKPTGGEIRVEALKHDEAKRRNIPTAELQSLLREEEAAPKPKLYSHKHNPDREPEMYQRNRDLDPQLVWRAKDEQDRAQLRVDTVPIYIQEKIHPKAIIEDLRRVAKDGTGSQADLFADFNGLPDEEARLEFYAHDQNWSNRMILGDSLLVMNSLAEKEGLRGRVQMIYVDPPYGIRFGSNWQVSTRRPDAKDGEQEDFSREPEVIKAFRDTWEYGVHSYLTYIRDRLQIARDLMSESGSMFVQIGDQNVHLVRSVLDELFGADNFISQITFSKTTGTGSPSIAGLALPAVADFILWYARDKNRFKYRPLFVAKTAGQEGAVAYSRLQSPDGDFVRSVTPSERDNKVANPPSGWHLCASDNITSQTGVEKTRFEVTFRGDRFFPAKGVWKTSQSGFERLKKANRITIGGSALRYIRRLADFQVYSRNNMWSDTSTGSFTDAKIFVVQTGIKVVQRCLLMTTDPGDLVLDPTCGSGTTAFVAEQWGRRWITIDTSRVALALARTRLMAARYSYYVLKDSPEGAQKESELTGRLPTEGRFDRDLRQGFVCERVPHITLKSIANNAEIDVIHERWQRELEPLRQQLNGVLGNAWEEWQILREADSAWSEEARRLHAAWWDGRRKRQEEIDASIARNAEVEYLYDRPYELKNVVRVTGPFTVESLSPHRVLPTDEDAVWREIVDDERAAAESEPSAPRPNGRAKWAANGEGDFVRVVLENLRAAGVENTKKGERLTFTELKPWPGRYVHAEGRYEERGRERRAAVVIGPEYGTVSYGLVRDAAREARDLFDVLVVCGFAFEPQVGEGTMSLGRLVVLKARMNQDLRMAEHLKKAGAGNLFVVFGEPDIEVRAVDGGERFEVEVKGVDIFDPTTGAIRSSADVREDIACWFIDTDYDEESFFVRHAYFLGGRDPYERLKRTLKAEIDEDAWATLYSTVSRPFPRPKSGRIAVKVINHHGDEALKVYDLGTLPAGASG